VIDEAYGEFVDDDEAVQGLDFYHSYPNVAVLRTFSKAYGLAGLRVGFAIAPAEVADFIRRTSTPFGVSSIAQAAVVASLQPQAETELLERVDALVQERDRVIGLLEAQGWKIEPQQANFFWIGTAERTLEIKDACEAAGVAVRPFPEGLRITIGESEANNRIIDVLGRFA